jgi:hypothetical protein
VVILWEHLEANTMRAYLTRLLIALGLFNQKNKGKYTLIRPGKIKTAIKTFFFIGLASFVIIEALILQSAISRHRDKTDYLIILGAGRGTSLRHGR